MVAITQPKAASVPAKKNIWRARASSKLGGVVRARRLSSRRLTGEKCSNRPSRR
jgi:hypothetical protein